MSQPTDNPIVPTNPSGDAQCNREQECKSVSALQDQHREMERLVRRYSVLLRLEHSLSSAESAKAAARIIVDAASELFHWDACNLNLYRAEEGTLDQLYAADTFDGQRIPVEPAAVFRPSPVYYSVLKEGAKLFLRTPTEVISTNTSSFGNTARRSASLMYVPLRQGSKSLGLFTLQSYAFNAYTEHDLQALQSLADHCSGTLRRLQGDQERRENEERNLVLLQLGKNLSSARTPQAAAEMIVIGASKLFGWDACTIDLYLADKDVLVPLLVMDTLSGEKKKIENDPSLPPSPLARRVLDSGSQLVLRSPEQVSSSEGLRFGNQKLSSSLMFACIRHGERTIGLISFQSYSFQAYKKQDLTVLEQLADYCAGALERIRIESHLRSTEVRFHSVWENSVDGMRLTDENGNILAVNEAYCKLVDMPREQLEGKPFTIVYEQNEQLQESLKKYQARFQKRILQRQITRRMKFRGGKTVDLEDTNSFIESNEGKTHLLSLFRDVTAQKQLEDELRQSQKMESVGQLAGGIAHDFNNILTVIGGHAALLLMDDELADRTREAIEQIANSTERAANLTRQLLAFSRKQMMQSQILDLNTVVQNMTKILQRVLGEDICLQVTLGAKLPSLYADSGMMEQILLNLAVNARDAMPQGGRLLIETSHEHVEASSPEGRSDVQPGNYVCLRVEDTGCGIPDQFLPKIFEPFFTTKDVGKGTGLGLATVYGIIKQHGGFIRVSSEVQQGTIFQVFLPYVTKPQEVPEKVAEPNVRGGSETILIVEDEEAVRRLAVALLKRLGYRCFEAGTGVQALSVWKDFGNAIDLVITDVVMPDGISGWDLAAQLHRSRPSVKIIFSSGYPRDSVGEAMLNKEGIQFLQKPYPPQALARLVRDTLDATSR